MWRALIVSLALICLVLLGWYAIKKYPGRIEADLAARAQAVLAQRVPGVTVQASQRDLVLSGRVETDEDRIRAERFASEVSGVKLVVSQLQVGAATPPAPEPTPEPVPEPDVVAAPDVQADAAADVQNDVQDAVMAADAVADGADTSGDATADVEAGPNEEVQAADAVADAAGPVDAAPETTQPPASGGLTPAQCKEQIAKAVEGENRIKFQSNTGKLTDEGKAKLTEVWALLQRCPDAKGVIEAYHDDFGDPDKVKQLTQIRAYNTHRRLIEMGMDEKRFRYIGLGYRNMRYRKPSERLLNQRIEFNITVE